MADAADALTSSWIVERTVDLDQQCRGLTLRVVGRSIFGVDLGDRAKENLTETVRHFRDYLPKYMPLPHPSPRNRMWMRRNPWFEAELLPELKTLIAE